MTSSSIPIGAAFHRLLHQQRLNAQKILLDVQQLKLSVRFFMSAQDDLNAAAGELVTAAQAAADMLRNSVGGDAAEAVAKQLHDAAASLKSATDAVSASGSGTQPSTAPSDGGGATPPEPATNPDGSPVSTNPDGTPVATNPDGTPVSVDPTQL